MTEEKIMTSELDIHVIAEPGTGDYVVRVTDVEHDDPATAPVAGWVLLDEALGLYHDETEPGELYTEPAAAALALVARVEREREAHAER